MEGKLAVRCRISFITEALLDAILTLLHFLSRRQRRKGRTCKNGSESLPFPFSCLCCRRFLNLNLIRIKKYPLFLNWDPMKMAWVKVLRSAAPVSSFWRHQLFLVHLFFFFFAAADTRRRRRRRRRRPSSTKPIPGVITNKVTPVGQGCSPFWR